MATGANPNLVTISVTDFNQFRLLVGEAIDLLDKKIDEFLNVQSLSCQVLDLTFEKGCNSKQFEISEPNLQIHQVNDILAVKTLDGATNDAILPEGGTTYILAQPVLTHESSGTYLGTSTGLTAPASTAQMALSSANTVTFSLTEFNTLRINVADSLLKIDQKIDEILNVATLSCAYASNDLRKGL